MEEPKIKPQYKLVAKYYLGAAAGNAEKAAIMAGYSERYARGNAYKLVAREDVRNYIEYLLAIAKEDPEYHIADIKETQAFWTEVMGNKLEKTRDRLRASELLAKAQGQFKKEEDW